MAAPTVDVLTKVSTDAAQKFVESYYHVLQSSRSTLSSFYVPAASMPDGKALPSIVFNGNVIPDALSFQTLFEKQMPQARYEVQCYDCHVLNVNYPTPPSDRSAPPGRNMSILVSVSGYARYGDSRDGPNRGFSESIILVPNTETQPTRQKGGVRKDWLIQSQNFRLTV
ncbi:MAG: hypothetical protein M1832_005642 [Thelocarpon impressellum]|nr:MAG: hypothetical protein M1832_005642 [Thelocarpon impressellum]